MPGRSIYAANGGAAGPVHLPGITQPRAARGRAKRFLRTVVVKPVPRFAINTTVSGLRLKRECTRHAPPVGPDRRVLGPFLPSRAVASQCQRAGSGVIDGTSRTISEALDLNPIFAGVVCPNADRQNASRATRAFATAAA